MQSATWEKRKVTQNGLRRDFVRARVSGLRGKKASSAGSLAWNFCAVGGNEDERVDPCTNSFRFPFSSSFFLFLFSFLFAIFSFFLMEQ